MDKNKSKHRRVIRVLFALVVLLSGCNPQGDSSLGPEPPYPVIDPANPSARDVTVTIPKGGSYSLAIDTDAEGKADPNGDAVIFVTNMTAPDSDHFVLDPDTGSITNLDITGGSFGPYNFWSREKDTAGHLDTADNPLSVTIQATGGS